MPIQPGGHLGAYRIEALLGQGGMGTVYRAFDTALQRPVAIKVLSEADEQARAKLLAEARAASALSHPNVATVHEVDEHDGQPYIVMELVEGKSLSELIPTDGLQPETVIRYGLQIADALAHAHEKGIIHRDLKSQNVVITPEGRAKVLDFGLAMRLEKQDAEAVTVSMDARADAGRIAGTLAYMAPEVLRGEEATARSDIWALGVLLYEMAAGQLPFGGTTRTDVVSAIVKDTLSPLPVKVSPGLRNIIQHCLTKEPARRYPHPSAIQAALETIQSDSGTQPTAISSPDRTRMWRIGVAACALLLAIGAGYLFRLRAPSTVASPVPRLTNPTQVTSAIGEEGYPTWSPDGSRLAFETGSTSPTGFDIWVTQLASGEPVNLTADNPDRDRYPSWSPDGSEIAFLSQREEAWGLYTVPAVGGRARRIRSLPLVFSGATPQWSADGTEIALAVRDQRDHFVEIVTVQTQETRRIPLPGGIPQPSMLSWSPDGRFFAYTDLGVSFDVNRLWLVSASGGNPVPVTEGMTRVLSPFWSADSRRLFFVSNRGGAMDLWQQHIDTESRMDGEPERLTTGVEMVSASFSSDGTMLAYARGRPSPQSNVWRVPLFPDRPATWSDAEQLTFEGNGTFWEMELSPDGESLVYSSDQTGNLDLWILPADGGPAVQLTTDPTPDWFPSWSPDSEQVVFQAYRSGNRDIWVIPVGGGPARPLTSHAADDMFPSWSPNGDQISFTSTRSGHSDLWIVPAEGGEPRQLTSDPIFDFNTYWSPDGMSVLVAGGGAMRRVPVDGGEPEALGPGFFKVSRGGSRYYRRTSDRGVQFFVASLVDEGERLVADLGGRPGEIDDMHMGSEHLYFGWGQRRSDIWVMDVVQDEP